MDKNTVKINSVKKILVSLFVLENKLKILEPEYSWTMAGAIVGDYGKLISRLFYNLTIVRKNTKNFTAKTMDGKTVLIKTNRKAIFVGFRGNADLMLVLKINEDGDWEEIYYGDFKLVSDNSTYGERDNKYIIPVTKLKELSI